MATTWVTGAAILAHARVTNPSADETAWAADCAGAVNAALDRRLDWSAAPEGWLPPADAQAELEAMALSAGAEAYNRRSAPWGVTGYQDLQGVAVRIARDYLEGIRPQIERWRWVGGGLG